MVKLELSERQAEYLNDIIDMWLEDFEESKKQAVDVDIFKYDQPEYMLQILDQLDWLHADAVDIKMKLLQARRKSA